MVVVYRIALLWIFVLVTKIHNTNSTSSCETTCNGTKINYPFGFNNGCDFQLNCSKEGEMEFMGFQIKNISSNSLLLNLSPSCTRPITQLRPLFGRNHALTSRNGLLLRNCTTPLLLDRCVIPASLVESRLSMRCNKYDGRRDNVSCFAMDSPSINNNGGVRFLSYEDVSGNGCNLLISSFVVDNLSFGDNSDTVLEFQAVQVSWWLTGKCRCDPNAECHTVGDSGYRCRCSAGFSGDGFVNGVGCHKVSVMGNNRLCGGAPKLHLPRCAGKEKERKMSHSLKMAILIISAFGGVLATTACTWLYLRCYKRNTKHVSASHSLAREPLSKVSYDMLLKATNGFSRRHLLGSGTFGSVYKGILDDGTIVAIKVVNLQHRGGSKSFLTECNVLRSIRHRNLVRTLTACSSIDYQRNDFKALVYKFMSNGNLDKWLHKEKGNNNIAGLNLLQRLDIAIDVAHALNYLHHECEDPIVHCDLKPSNILLDDDFVAHVADFGLAKVLGQPLHPNQSSLIGVRGTLGYVAPEYGLGAEATLEADIYSYGILLLELMTRKRPTTEVFHEDFNLHMYAKAALPDQVLQIVDLKLNEDDHVDDEDVDTMRMVPRSSERLRRREECIKIIAKIGVACSHQLPQDRIAISAAISELQQARNNILNPRNRHLARGTTRG